MSNSLRVLIVMGVSGSGKTTLARKLAILLKAKFYEGDDFHPPENIAKMSALTPLTDEDRQPWLAKIRELIAETPPGKLIVISCSALKRQYREVLRQEDVDVHFLHLQANYPALLSRLEARKDHFMKPDMLKSQFETLELPDLTERNVHPLPCNQNLNNVTRQAMLLLNPLVQDQSRSFKRTPVQMGR